MRTLHTTVMKPYVHIFAAYHCMLSALQPLVPAPWMALALRALSLHCIVDAASIAANTVASCSRFASALMVNIV